MQPSTEHKRSQSFRPPILSAAMAAGLGYLAYYLHGLGRQTGVEWALPACLIVGLIAVRTAIRGLDDQGKIHDERAKHHGFKESAKRHGDAGLQPPQEIPRRRMFAKKGIFLGSQRVGRFRHRDLRYDGDCCVNVCGPPGCMKSMCIAVPTLLTDLGHSRIVNDPSGIVLSDA
ncbi:MAG: hypothetical protein R3C19_25595 [Planctomycetaceae bacterium]